MVQSSTDVWRRQGVSLDDLLQFKRLVHHCVQDGCLRPTELDKFSASDMQTGPTAYTVNEQLIKPVTSAAGNVSWALLKHPTGLIGDLFITHAWAEGLFDFVDKVSHSWPPGAVGAYICFLSNPQNLDIGDLLQVPSQSPFANALRQSSSLLVIPNHSYSVYTRIWCVYEAFLGYSWDKPIRVARRPPESYGFKVLRVPCTGLAVWGGTILILMSQTSFYGFSRDSQALLSTLELAFLGGAGACGSFVLLLYLLRNWRLAED
ncbi:unnamed protein product [Symbiodinium necroappetens]|uniref:Uncharacterized protein n=1 Tax=Symbiodinium necroappetens TaxID=1628268 RepID=A0A813CHP0_9DINO|nr:unnamed protein product [Symbiodinium necroappetens]